MKYQEILKSTQPVFYRILTRSFTSGNVPHAYLLVGNNTDDAATFIAQSLVCRKEVLACEECNDCRRIKERLYPDMIVFDGNETSIKKEDIEHIQTEFYKSSFENKAKIYILKQLKVFTPFSLHVISIKCFLRYSHDARSFTYCQSRKSPLDYRSLKMV